MYDDIIDTVISAYGVSEEQFAALPGVLHCLRGDLGRYKASDNSADLTLGLTCYPNATRQEVTAWLRQQDITHDVELTSRWVPGDPAPAASGDLVPLAR